MNYLWFLAGIVTGQGLVLLACYLGEVLKERYR